MYVDAICIPDRTYRITPQGANGMLPDQCRNSLHLHACTPYRFVQEQELCVAYLSSVLNFLGVTDQKTALLVGDDPGLGSQEEYETVRAGLLELALRF